jgi:uncharacterized protein DUF29
MPGRSSRPKRCAVWPGRGATCRTSSISRTSPRRSRTWANRSCIGSRAVRLILLHLVKAASVRDARAGDHWRKEVRIWRIDLRKDLTASMRAKIDLDAAWEVAVTKAEIDLATAGDQVIPGLPGRCPFAVDDLADEPFDFDEAVERVRAAAARPDPLPR